MRTARPSAESALETVTATGSQSLPRILVRSPDNARNLSRRANSISEARRSGTTAVGNWSNLRDRIERDGEATHSLWSILRRLVPPSRMSMPH